MICKLLTTQPFLSLLLIFISLLSIYDVVVVDVGRGGGDGVGSNDVFLAH